MARLCPVPREREQGCEDSTVICLASTYSSVSLGRGRVEGAGSPLSGAPWDPWRAVCPLYLCLLLDRLNQNFWGEVWAKAPNEARTQVRE